MAESILAPAEEDLWGPERRTPVQTVRENQTRPELRLIGRLIFPRTVGANCEKKALLRSRPVLDSPLHCPSHAKLRGQLKEFGARSQKT